MVTKVGVLALQGDFAEHEAALRRIGVVAQQVRLPADLAGLDGLIIPGGESTTIGTLMVRFGLFDPLVERARSGFPIWGTCAGMIVLAKRIEGSMQPTLGVMDITVRRNAFGRQIDSFETDLEIAGLEQPYHAVFIRAPLITEVGPAAKAIATLPDGRVVAAEQGNLLATAFHPELTADDRMHQLFVQRIREGAGAR
ncbi:MAG: pyridoxal 5'-phosphate synthase glutaminase subunit PdxT [Chloroflexota bacterium]|nr:pyridoxal 5'-phosphate synthase glutaminase subunit PdxT [Dehalococcoidia bacterium]MDW8252931.1 pyridoxal 5'-phosphate synthase glutaminase subunit PdxT [Chloroflexota bacterium]